MQALAPVSLITLAILTKDVDQNVSWILIARLRELALVPNASIRVLEPVERMQSVTLLTTGQLVLAIPVSLGTLIGTALCSRLVSSRYLQFFLESSFCCSVISNVDISFSFRREPN